MKEQCKNCIYLAKLYVPPIHDFPKDKWVCTLFLNEGQVMYLDSDKDMCEGFRKRERHCVNCRHNIRKKDENGNIYCECEIEGGYISYLQSFEGWCRHWAKDKESEGRKESKE